MITKFQYGGISDIGCKRELNEDYISITELDDHTLFAVISDGAGSKATGETPMQPASIVTREMNEIVQRVYKQDKNLLLENAEVILSEAIHCANRVLGAFKIANEELYAGFGASVTCCLLHDNNTFAFAHTGNTRLYLIRVNPKDGGISVKQLTVDQTKARDLVTEGYITLEQYHTHPDRLIITGGLGVVVDPIIQTYSGKIKDLDFLLMTTDGIHYAVRPEPMAELVIRSEKSEDAVNSLVTAAKSLQYNDNMSAIVVFNGETSA